MRRLIAFAASLAVAAPAFGQAAAGLTRIGAAAAVKGLVSAQAPGAPAGRVIESGKTLFLNDHVTTDKVGRLQVLLLDETVFTLGPNSDMVLDEFVYDPKTSEGKVAAQVTKGVFRFVTGKVARRDPSSMNVKVPAGTIGIRGTIVIGQIEGDKTTVILGGPGGHGDADESRGAFILDGKLVEEPGYGLTCTGAQCSRVEDLSDLARRINGVLGTVPDRDSRQTSRAEDAGRASGQDSAAAKGDTAQSLVDTRAQADQLLLLQHSLEQADVPVQSTWEELRANTQLGSVTYQSPKATTACTDVNCFSSTVDFDFNLTVNFSARTYNGNVQLSNGVSNSSNPSGSFASSTGNAVITDTTGNFNGTTFTLYDAGGAVAKSAVMKLQYNDTISNIHVTGTTSATR